MRVSNSTMVLASLTISGPYNVAGPGDTPSREKIFTCKAITAKDEGPCAKKILSSLAYQAFRRPVTPKEVEVFLGFVALTRKQGDSFEEGIATALQAILNEWKRSDADYSTCIAHLRGTQSGGLNGSFFLTTTTVKNDNVSPLAYSLIASTGARSCVMPRGRPTPG